MKKILTLLIVSISIITINISNLNAIDIGFYFGLSTPNDKINEIYNKSKVDLDSIEIATKEIAKTGYHFAMKGRLELDDDWDLVFGIGFHRFPETLLEFENPSSDASYQFKTVQNVVPFNVGVNYYLISAEYFGLYLNADLTYNYVVTTTDFELSPKAPSIPLELLGLGEFENNKKLSSSDGQIGFGAGAGIDVDLKLLLINLDVKFNLVNVLGKEDGEQAKNYLSIGLGVYF